MVRTDNEIVLKKKTCGFPSAASTGKIIIKLKGDFSKTKAPGESQQGQRSASAKFQQCQKNVVPGKEPKQPPLKLSEMSLMQLASVPVKTVQKSPPLSMRQIIHGWWRH